jgi:transcriptional regulator with XRE-family HTH domain
MRLVAWRKQKGWTQTQLAKELGVTQPYVSLMERAVAPAVPNASVMKQIFELSEGQVTPNDFYELPDLQAQEAA